VIFADLDRFSEYNHHYGDTAGDHALTTVAAQLLAGLGDGDQVFRKGGEEFVALLPGATPEVTAIPNSRVTMGGGVERCQPPLSQLTTARSHPC
jgi:diguanylate cyclase (GGDEF)-like protein